MRDALKISSYSFNPGDSSMHRCFVNKSFYSIIFFKAIFFNVRLIRLGFKTNFLKSLLFFDDCFHISYYDFYKFYVQFNRFAGNF